MSASHQSRTRVDSKRLNLPPNAYPARIESAKTLKRRSTTRCYLGVVVFDAPDPSLRGSSGGGDVPTSEAGIGWREYGFCASLSFLLDPPESDD